MSESEKLQDVSRRSFLTSGTGLFTSAWIVANWPGISAAAHHADEAASAGGPLAFKFFTAAEGKEVEAIGAQIVPSGKTPGAREAHAVYFIDHTLADFFKGMAQDFRHGLEDFQSKFRAANPKLASFSAASSDQQIEFLKTVDRTPFFETVRMLTILGMFSSPKYGGNFQGLGWKTLGFVDQHAFAPPFGYYDRDYPGFVPYPEKHA